MDPIANERGIYLWTIKANEKYLVEYVGETRESFNKRTKEHLIQVLGGNYRSLDTDYYESGEVKVLWNGLWRKETQNKLSDFVGRYVELAPKILGYVESINLFVAPL